MALKFSTDVKNAELDAIEATVGASAILKIRTGAPPASIADADSGTVLTTINLPSDWMAAANAGSKALAGSWSDSSADATGDAGHFRIYASDGTTQKIQGTVTAVGGGGDMTLDSASAHIEAGQTVSIGTFTITAGN